MLVNRGQWAAFLFFVPVLDTVVTLFFIGGQSGVVVPAISKGVPVLLALSKFYKKLKNVSYEYDRLND